MKNDKAEAPAPAQPMSVGRCGDTFFPDPRTSCILPEGHSGSHESAPITNPAQPAPPAEPPDYCDNDETAEFLRREDAAAPSPAISEPQLDWKETVIEACVVNCIGWDESNPKKTLADLISWEVRVALDPKVSEAAAKLRDTYKVDAPAISEEEVARFAVNHYNGWCVERVGVQAETGGQFIHNLFNFGEDQRSALYVAGQCNAAIREVSGPLREQLDYFDKLQARYSGEWHKETANRLAWQSRAEAAESQLELCRETLRDIRENYECGDDVDAKIDRALQPGQKGGKG